jgi:Kyakuja-Dileera-Zisupton transposase
MGGQRRSVGRYSSRSVTKLTVHRRDSDVIVCMDGCFQHRRFSSVRGDPEIITDDHLRLFLPSTDLESAKNYISSRRHIDKPSARQDARVPRGSLDECEKSHHAARDRGDESAKGIFASTELMAMVCHHDIPLFLCDITTPGEQQFYAIALIQRLASLLPDTATIAILYDIACTLERSISKVRECTETVGISLIMSTVPDTVQHDLIPELAPGKTDCSQLEIVSHEQVTLRSPPIPRTSILVS